MTDIVTLLIGLVVLAWPYLVGMVIGVIVLVAMGAIAHAMNEYARSKHQRLLNDIEERLERKFERLEQKLNQIEWHLNDIEDSQHPKTEYPDDPYIRNDL